MAENVAAIPSNRNGRESHSMADGNLNMVGHRKALKHLLSAQLEKLSFA
jgi:ABC-type transport system involved in cytochrome c biogenesis ATPase subunit